MRKPRQRFIRFDKKQINFVLLHEKKISFTKPTVRAKLILELMGMCQASSTSGINFVNSEIAPTRVNTDMA